MYSVTLHRLDPEARSASPDFEACTLRDLSPDELAVLLDHFCRIDPIENVHADPEIHIEKGRKRYIVQAGRKKLCLYEARHRNRPGLIVTPAELLAELSGSARATPTPPTLIASTETETPVYVPPVATPRRSVRTVVLLLATLGLFLAATFLVLREPAEDPLAAGQPLRALPSAEQVTARRTVVGVFMTGPEPGDHGIALAEDGSAKFFRLNERTAPNVVFDSFQLARRGTSLVAIVERLGTEIEFMGADTLVYGREPFFRLK